MGAFWDWTQLLAGGLLLYFGAEWLVTGAARLALALGLRPLVVGLTVVAYATSAPELTVGVAAALEGKSAITLGNTIGSNIANFGLILGLTTLISPPQVDSGLIRREIPFLVVTALLVPTLLIDGEISRTEGALMVLASIGYTVWMILRSPKENAPASADKTAAVAGRKHVPLHRRKVGMVAILVLGLVVLTAGGKVFVHGAVGIALWAGISERVVGLTIVAMGTSLPELAASVVAALRGHSSIAVGNVIGSNIFNVLLVLGTAGLIHPIEGSVDTMRSDLAFLIALTVIAAIILRTERILLRLEGIVLMALYGAFLVALATMG